jgi:hypothetical protein
MSRPARKLTSRMPVKARLGTSPSADGTADEPLIVIAEKSLLE